MKKNRRIDVVTTNGIREINDISFIPFVVGDGNSISPKDGSNNLLLPCLCGKFLIQKNGYGVMTKGIDYDKIDGGIQLRDGNTFINGQTYLITLF